MSGKKDLTKVLRALRVKRRRERIAAQSSGDVTPEFKQEILSRTHCEYCKQFIEPVDRTIEHIQPIAKGGLHARHNITMACKGCNCSKGAKSYAQYKGLILP